MSQSFWVGPVFKFKHCRIFSATTFVSGICSQNRKTERPPGKYLEKVNPLAPTKANIEIDRKLFSEDAKPTTCKLCHRSKGNGNGSLAKSMEIPPRNFTCEPLMQDLPDGQLFWIIKMAQKVPQCRHINIPWPGQRANLAIDSVFKKFYESIDREKYYALAKEYYV